MKKLLTSMVLSTLILAGCGDAAELETKINKLEEENAVLVEKVSEYEEALAEVETTKVKTEEDILAKWQIILATETSLKFLGVLKTGNPKEIEPWLTEEISYKDGTLIFADSIQGSDNKFKIDGYGDFSVKTIDMDEKGNSIYTGLESPNHFYDSNTLFNFSFESQTDGSYKLTSIGTDI
ncbi:hypothetical protein JFL43_03715 [Viridibacillus sp. YIM B01967]|uniref:Lipoprotein n=1 Tax=Viridibacillus soli TaxID=2798301 RepID=A0ABS1H3U7_9BACL|nr:hypothetical protein [Viridibacillus soli]MBK3493979.1 hypothetical protein [Viridibacillus soli]